MSPPGRQAATFACRPPALRTAALGEMLSSSRSFGARLLTWQGRPQAPRRRTIALTARAVLHAVHKRDEYRRVQRIGGRSPRLPFFSGNWVSSKVVGGEQR